MRPWETMSSSREDKDKLGKMCIADFRKLDFKIFFFKNRHNSTSFQKKIVPGSALKHDLGQFQ